jgi:hypothetical protein
MAEVGFSSMVALTVAPDRFFIRFGIWIASAYGRRQPAHLGGPPAIRRQLVKLLPKHGAVGFGEPISTLHKQTGAFEY